MVPLSVDILIFKEVCKIHECKTHYDLSSQSVLVLLYCNITEHKLYCPLNYSLILMTKEIITNLKTCHPYIHVYWQLDYIVSSSKLRTNHNWQTQQLKSVYKEQCGCKTSCEICWNHTMRHNMSYFCY